MSKPASNDLTSNIAEPLFEAIDRNDSDLPKDFIPWAQVVLRANDGLVHRATEGCPPYSRHRRWQTVGSVPGEAWIRIEPDCALVVIPRGEFWFAIRRVTAKRKVSSGLLSFVLGPGPICTHTREAAMRLAEYYHFFPTADGMQWFDMDMDNYSGNFLQPLT